MDICKIPEILGTEHQAIRAELEAATTEGGSTGAAARSLAEAMRARFESEQGLGLAQRGPGQEAALATIPSDIRGVIALSEDLKLRLEEALAGHQAIAGRLESFRQAALEERKPHYVRFADMLRALLRSEEELIYPAGILIGGYLRLTVADPGV